MKAIVVHDVQDAKPMSNPFTRFLSNEVDDDPLIAFIDYWDRLEALVISIYKNDAAGSEDEREYEQVWPWLIENYPVWRSEFRPYWSQSGTGGGLEREDPFTRLLAAPSAAEIAGDWTLMQALPAAREALNLFVLEKKSK